MNNKTYFIVQMVGLASLVILGVLEVLLFLNASDRMTVIEQKQAVLENHLDLIRNDGLNISH